MEGIFFQIGVLVIIATLFSFLSKALKQPLIPAYIFAGILIGPLLGIIGDTGAILQLSEIGIAFLLFVVGLELDFKKLKQIGMVASIGATVQIVLLFLLGFAIGLLTGFSSMSSVYIGLIVSFSSTMVVVKLLSDKSELDTLHGKIIIGFLLIEDFFAIIALSMLNTIGNVNFLFIIIAILKVFVVLFVSYFINRFLFQPMFKYASKSQELLFMVSISSCFFFAFFFQYFGTSMIAFFNILGIHLGPNLTSLISPGFSIAMGAFIAGIGLASMPYAFEVIGKVRSIRDFFATLFFVSLGVQLTNSSLMSMLKPMILLLILILVIKPVITFFIITLFGYTKRVSFETASSLAQTSEFSLIIVASGFAMGHISQDFISLAVMLSLVTITTTSYGIKFNTFIYNRLSRLLAIFERFGNKDGHLEFIPDSEIKNEVLLVGFDRIGYNVYETLKKLKKRFLIVDFNPDVIHKLINDRVHCVYGDIGDGEIIERVNLHSAKTVISTIPDPESTMYLILQTRKVNERCTLIVTSYNVDDALEFYNAGADYVILPHLLGGRHASFILEEFDRDFKTLVSTRAEHINELNRRLHLGHNKNLKK